jgi:hypothetical protein
MHIIHIKRKTTIHGGDGDIQVTALTSSTEDVWLTAHYQDNLVWLLRPWFAASFTNVCTRRTFTVHP